MKHKPSEGHKMWLSVMAIFLVYAAVFILFEDYDRKSIIPFKEASDWHLMLFSLIVMCGLAFLLFRYARRMDEQISREQAEKENQMRRELTQNIAHELKTPVASILGYTETILDNPDMTDDTRQQFIQRTHSQAKLLTALLHDISTLNKMDYAPQMMKKEQVDITALVDDIAQETALNMKRRQMTMHNNLPQQLEVCGNRMLIYSIFRNLTENAINYAGEGKTIEITAKAQHDEWMFTFKDNGTGIPEEHLPRIFERFYRIDQGRSRDMGGTGLGLAIVKNAVALHGGTITARCPHEGGLEFLFTLKK